MKNNIHFLLILLPLFLLGCGNKKEVLTDQKSNLIEISQTQFETNSMQLGKIETLLFENVIKCSATVETKPNGFARVNTQISGVVKTIFVQNGQFVEKNQVLIEIYSNELIDMQREFAETSAHHKRIKMDYERLKTLFHEKVTSEKDFIIAESDYKASHAKYTGLKMKLEALGFSISKIENGEFYPTFSIKAPIKGHISSLNTHLGTTIDSQSELLTITDPSLMQLRVQVFANDISNLKKGQMVRFQTANSTDTHNAILQTIGVSLDQQSKSIYCYASISDLPAFVPLDNELVECEIITKTDSSKGLPNDAFIKSESEYSILVIDKQEKEKYFCKKVAVKVGREQKGFTEIIEPILPELVITKGVYSITF